MVPLLILFRGNLMSQNPLLKPYRVKINSHCCMTKMKGLSERDRKYESSPFEGRLHIRGFLIHFILFVFLG